MCIRDRRQANQIYDEVKRHFQELVFNTVIQRNVKLLSLIHISSLFGTIALHDDYGPLPQEKESDG